METSSPEAEGKVREPDGKTPLAELLPRVRAHDELAARELVERLYPLVAPIVHANLPRRDPPEDLMQDVFLKMFSRLDQFRGEVPFERWVARIALNTCLDRLRRQKARPELRWADLSEDEQALFAEIPDERSATDADTTSARALAEKLLAELPADDAWLLRQIELEQRGIAEVCAARGWSSGVTRIRLFRARRRLQKLMRQLESANA